MTIRRYHGAESERYMFSSSTVILPDGSMPLEVTCVIRLLPRKRDRIRLADYRIPYQTLRFKDYSQDPYCMAEDSLILRWDMSKTLTFYVDTLFPKEYFQAVKEGVSAWNTAFRKAGIHDALQVKYANKKIIPAEQRAFISYDLKMPGIKKCPYTSSSYGRDTFMSSEYRTWISERAIRWLSAKLRCLGFAYSG